MIPVIPGPRQTKRVPAYNLGVNILRIAVIGDTECRVGAWTDAAAIAIECAAQASVHVGLRSVAIDQQTASHLRAALVSAGVTPWISERGSARDEESRQLLADVRMGDPLQIPDLFDHDVIVLACRDARLRRFLADLPVHTRPDVRIIACLDLDHGPVAGERQEDLLRFDTLIGSESTFGALEFPFLEASPSHPLASIQRRMHGSNLRAAVAWSDAGAFSVVERDGAVLSLPPQAPASPPHSVHSGSAVPARWPAFVGATAIGIAGREPWVETGRRATEAWSRPSYT